MFGKKVFLVVAACAIALAVSTVSAGAAVVLGVRHWVAPDHIRFVIDTSDEACFSIEKGDRRLAVILEDSTLASGLSGVKVFNRPGLNSVLMYASSDLRVRIELKLSGNLHADVFKLKKFRDKPDRIVVDIALPLTTVEKDGPKDRGNKAKGGVMPKNRVVVIDPGHGGDDPGAVGKNGTFEKDVVLDISRKLFDIINKKDGYRAFLTRDGDYYVPFKKRLMVAREHGADLFISIHADASRNRAARGSSVYCIAEGAASSEAARILAGNENLADVIGGVPAGEQSDFSDPIILNMFQTHVKNQSRSFGRILLNEIKNVSDLKFRDVQEAPFYVLKLPEITSVLLETAYLSNPQEEKLLKNDRFQNEIARAAADSILKFLPPVVGSAGRQEGDPQKATTTYKVKPGDTLYSIAVSYGTTADALKEINKMNRPDLLYVGASLIVPFKEN